MGKKLSIFKDIDLEGTVSILLLTGILSGIFGFLYETIFYRIDLGYFVKRGSTFGPWIPIYFFGGILIMLFSYRFRKKPLVVFLINCIVLGALEYATGYVLFRYFSTRLWDYYKEIWNFGNIKGYICLRSVLFFGVSSLILVYVVTPLILKIYNKTKKRNFKYMSILLTCIFTLDVIAYAIFK